MTNSFRWIPAIIFIAGSMSATAGPHITFLGADLGAYGISADGLTIVGGRLIGTGEQAVKWTEARGRVDLGYLNGGNYSDAFAVTPDGSIVVGDSMNISFRWTQATGMVSIGNLAGPENYGECNAVSDDGNVIVGGSFSQLGHEAYRWSPQTGMVGLGDLPGGDYFGASTGVTPDGSVVVGYSSVNYGFAPFRWTQATGMVALEGNGGASAISRDGRVIVGSANSNAVRWTDFGMETLYQSQGGTRSSAVACSADGKVVVGFADYSANTSSEHAFIWIQGRGAFRLADIAAAAGIHLGGRILLDATGISADGKVICGWMDDSQGGQAYVLNLRKAREVGPPTTVGGANVFSG